MYGNQPFIVLVTLEVLFDFHVLEAIRIVGILIPLMINAKSRVQIEVWICLISWYCRERKGFGCYIGIEL